MTSAIREWSTADRPRERLDALRAESLSSRELLAIVLGSGGPGRSALDLASELLLRFDGSLRSLGQAEAGALRTVPGIGPARAASVAAAFELGRRSLAECARRGARIRGPRDVFLRLGPALRDRRQEEFWVVYLDTQNRVLSERRITVGLLNSSLVHPREVFAPAIALAAASLIVAHNHPSGDPAPSPEDLDVTLQLVESGRLLGIPVRDHVVLGDGAFVSLLERGLLLPGPATQPSGTATASAGYRSGSQSRIETLPGSSSGTYREPVSSRPATAPRGPGRPYSRQGGQRDARVRARQQHAAGVAPERGRLGEVHPAEGIPRRRPGE
jgi:DNA repair protein RadC